MKVTLGGDRLGSGKKNRIALNDYELSTHDLSQKFTSSMQVGTLYPFLCIPAMRGDKFTIDLEADARTIPTKGPLFGSFKMQIDLFQCDVRLYQALLHNNPINLGLNMKDVKFPLLRVFDKYPGNAFSNSCLLKYLGMSGLGTLSGAGGQDATPFRKINAIPTLAYYEIFKTYYANKQEENAYIITTINELFDPDDFKFEISNTGGNLSDMRFGETAEYHIPTIIKVSTNYNYKDYINFLGIGWKNNGQIYAQTTYADLLNSFAVGTNQKCLEYLGNDEFRLNGYPVLPTVLVPDEIEIINNRNEQYKHRGLQEFKLENIDEMRLKLLSHHTLGRAFEINGMTNEDEQGVWDNASGVDSTGLPYINLVNYSDLGNYSRNCEPLNGLVVKTYQSDLYNNWVNTEWIDGENGIAEITAISTAGGSIKIDSLNLSEKLYNMLNRVAVSDGSYEGWQDAVYTETPKRHIESPVYLGGMSSEIVFEEIVQTSPDGEGLGTLAGKGRIIKNKGGKVTVKCNEAAFIIGIVSLTPRINYSQGNEWYLTELFSMDDYHKPALDGIGFQNLLGERLAWWDTHLNSGAIISRSTIGKVPAWIEYMTAVDKCYGDFAETEGRGFMNLLREYERTDQGKIKDATTYIDPRKYNYAFAYQDIDAQNFWVQIYSKITARRLMSAKQIPNI